MRNRILVLVAVLGPFAWFFGPALVQKQSFAFRDTAYLYYPLFHWLDQEWRDGRVPLWNPLVNCGMPAVGDTTSSVFYPGKLLFATSLDFALQFKLYIMLHVLLATVTAYILARRWGASQLAACVCGVSHAYGGTVLFETCNPIFLVGSAWLPLALLFVRNMLERRSAVDAVWLGVCLALIVTGGDPHLAYNIGLLAAGYALILWMAKAPIQLDTPRKASAPGPQPVPASAPAEAPAEEATDEASPTSAPPPLPQVARGWTFWRLRPVLLAMAAVAGAVLSAVQVLPSMDWGRMSVRSVSPRPRNIYQAASLWARGSKHETEARNQEIVSVQEESVAERIRLGLFGTPLEDSHSTHIYGFSCGPWRLVELFWPNVSGTLFPSYRRWIRIFPFERAPWMPSLYIGLIPALLAVSSWRPRDPQRHWRWISWSVLFSIIAGCGWYGIGWVWQLTRPLAVGDDPFPGAPVGGLYWCLVTFLPGYSQFRFPAKWLAIATLGGSLLASRGWDHVFSSRPHRGLRGWLFPMAALSLLGSIFVLGNRTRLEEWIRLCPSDTTLGPVDFVGAVNDLFLSFTQTLVVSAAAIWLLAARPGESNPGAGWRPVVTLLLVIADLAWSNSWLVPMAPDRLWTSPSRIATQIAEQDEQLDAEPGYRVLRGKGDRWGLRKWPLIGSTTRLAETVKWGHDSLDPSYHLLYRLAVVDSDASIMPDDFMAFLDVGRRLGPERPDGEQELAAPVANALAARYLVLQPGTLPRSPGQRRDLDLPDNVDLFHNPRHFPRAWIVHRIEQRSASSGRDPIENETRAADVLLDGINLRDFARVAVVETDLPLPLPAASDHDESESENNAAGESCQIILDTPQHIEIEARLATPGLVVLSDYFEHNWTVDVHPAGEEPTEAGQRHPILRTNRIMRGVYLPAGNHRLVFRYRPRAFYIGAALSAVAWLALPILGFVARRRSRGNDPPV